jgi:hypothetical protein
MAKVIPFPTRQREVGADGLGGVTDEMLSLELRIDLLAFIERCVALPPSHGGVSSSLGVERFALISSQLPAQF